MQYTRDLTQWMYAKRAPMPGAYLAAMQLPGIRGLAFPGTLNAVGWTLQNMVCDPAETWSAEEGIGVDLSASWPGIVYATGYVGGSGRTEWSGTSFTVCAWLWINTLADFGELLGYWNTKDAADERHMVVDTDVGGAVRYRVSGDGAAATVQTATTAAGLVAAGQWHMVGMRFAPSVSFALILDGVIYSNTTSPLVAYHDSPDTSPATLTLYPSWDSAESHYAKQFAGRVSQVWDCVYAVPDHMIAWLWSIQAPLYGRV